ncbi:hypothetical protein OPV22_034535 [Ensete ventricosum]|uniref:DUF3700 domain-containing protein n=1 Tax=Ensete ventricosum TaxID=4639 RepID=A0AAV8Q536_ENSVE|nr:hypothetical protein OPV22_034535 [Ensete ventricosum]
MRSSRTSTPPTPYAPPPSAAALPSPVSTLPIPPSLHHRRLFCSFDEVYCMPVVPYPGDQVLEELAGSFAFVVYDNKTGAVFTALSSDGGVPLSIVICDDVETIKGKLRLRSLLGACSTAREG